jgi:hypothetical protein
MELSMTPLTCPGCGAAFQPAQRSCTACGLLLNSDPVIGGDESAEYSRQVTVAQRKARNKPAARKGQFSRALKSLLSAICVISLYNLGARWVRSDFPGVQPGSLLGKVLGKKPPPPQMSIEKLAQLRAKLGESASPTPRRTPLPAPSHSGLLTSSNGLTPVLPGSRAYELVTGGYPKWMNRVSWDKPFQLVSSLKLLADFASKALDRRPIGFLSGGGKLLSVETPMTGDLARSGSDVLRVWDASSGAPLRQQVIPVLGRYSFNSRRNLLAVHQNHLIELLQADTGSVVASVSDNRYPQPDWLALFPEGDRLAVMREDFTIVRGNAGYLAILNTDGMNKAADLPVSSKMSWTGISVSPDGKNLLLSNDAYLFVMDAATGNILQRFHAGYQPAFSYSPDGKFVVTVGSYPNQFTPRNPMNTTTRVQVWSVATWTLVRTVEEFGYGGRAIHAQFSDDSRALFVIPRRGVHIYDADSGRLVQRLAEDRTYGGVCGCGLAFDPVSHSFALATGGGEVQILRAVN